MQLLRMMTKMRHKYGNAKLSKPTDQRIALLRSIALGLFKNKRVFTTLHRAKATVPLVEKVVTLAKKQDLHSRRQALQIIPDATVIKEVFESLGNKFADRPGGYTRIVKAGFRQGDGAQRVLLEFVD